MSSEAARAGAVRSTTAGIADAAVHGQGRLLASVAGWSAVAGVCLLPVLLYWPVLMEPLDSDEGAYATIAQGLLRGELPYRDLWDHKPPFVYGWYALSFLLFGEEIWAPRLMASFAWSAASFMVFLEGRLIYGRRAGFIAAGLFSLSSGFVLLQGNANTEPFLLLPLAASLVAFTRALQSGKARWFLLAGACGAAAALTKQVAALNLLVLALFLVFTDLRQGHRRQFVTRLATLSTGSAIVLGATLLPFLLGGALDDFYYANVTYNRLYTGSMGMEQRLARGISNSLYSMRAASIISGATLLALLDMRRSSRTSFDYLVLALLAASAIGVLLSGWFFPHYFITMLPFAALLSGRFFGRERGPEAGMRPVYGAAALLVGLMVWVNAPVYLESSPDERHAMRFIDVQAETHSQSFELAHFIESLTEPEDKIWEYGRATQIYFYAGREPSMRFMYDRPFWLDESTRREAMAELKAHPPVLVIDTLTARWEELGTEITRIPPDIRAFLDEHYDYEGLVTFGRVYRLKGYEPGQPDQVAAEPEK